MLYLKVFVGLVGDRRYQCRQTREQASIGELKSLSDSFLPGGSRALQLRLQEKNNMFAMMEN